MQADEPWSAANFGKLVITATRWMVCPRSKSKQKRSSSGISSSTMSASMSAADCQRANVGGVEGVGCEWVVRTRNTHRAMCFEQVGLAEYRVFAKFRVVVITEQTKPIMSTSSTALSHRQKNVSFCSCYIASM